MIQSVLSGRVTLDGRAVGILYDTMFAVSFCYFPGHNTPKVKNERGINHARSCIEMSQAVRRGTLPYILMYRSLFYRRDVTCQIPEKSVSALRSLVAFLAGSSFAPSRTTQPSGLPFASTAMCIVMITIPSLVGSLRWVFASSRTR